MPTPHPTSRIPLAGLLLIAIAAASCAAPAPGPITVAPPVMSTDKLIGLAICNADSECRVIGVGARACGGPEAYRAWSFASTDAFLLEAAVAREAAIRRAEIERSGMLSTCEVIPVPGVACVRTSDRPGPGRCTLIPPAGDTRGRPGRAAQ